MEILEIEQCYICAEAMSENVIHQMFEFLDDDEEKNDKKSEFDDLNIKNIKNPFHGLLANEIKCTECNYSNEIRQTSFTCLTLSLCDNIHSSLQSVYLKDRMAAFEIDEAIDGYRCMLCECNGLIHKLQTMNKENMSNIQLRVLEEQYTQMNETLK